MALLSELKPKPGSRHSKKRIGFGEGSGHGGSATRGMKGQRSRSGDGKKLGFEGGQTPLLRRIPKRGFNNKNFTVRYEVLNLDVLEAFFKSGVEVTPAAMAAEGLVSVKGLVKVLGGGKISKALKVTAHAFSTSAKSAIEGAGGSRRKSSRQG